MNKVMKNGLKLAAVGLVLVTGRAMAGPILVPTQVSIDDYAGSNNAKYWEDNGSYGGMGGAWNMTVYDQNGNIMDTMVAFCLEVTESIGLSAGSIRYNISMADYAARGGRGGQTQQEPEKDYLSDESAWLYFQTARRDGNGNYDGNYGDMALWADVQHALWMLENEIDDDAHLQYILNRQYGNGDPDAHYASIMQMIADARNAVSNPGALGGGIVVYNLWGGNIGYGPKQSMIAFAVPSVSGEEPVSEPVTLLLTGGGLLGLAGLRRRRRSG